MRGRRVLVVGDVMLDEFLWGRVSRISPEAPVPVVEVTRQSFHLGGAGNVAANVRSLGGSAVLVGLVGRDAAGDHVREALRAAGVVPRLVSAPDRPTTVKTRIVAHSQQVVRADREESRDVAGAAAEAIRETLRAELADCDALVVSDYQKGVVTASLLRSLLPLARRRRTAGPGGPQGPALRPVPRRDGRDAEPARDRAGDGDPAARRRRPGRLPPAASSRCCAAARPSSPAGSRA